MVRFLITTVVFVFSRLICPTLSIAASAHSADPGKEAKLKGQYDQLLVGVQKDLESQKDQVTRTEKELKAQREQVDPSRFHLSIE